MNTEATPANVGSMEGLGPLPAASLTHDRHGHALLIGPCYTAEAMRAYATEQVAAERERWSAIAKSHMDMAVAMGAKEKARTAGSIQSWPRKTEQSDEGGHCS